MSGAKNGAGGMHFNDRLSADWPTRLMVRCLALAFTLLISGNPAAAQTGPPKPTMPAGRDPGGIAVAIIGAGIDYRRPEIAARIARDGEGEIIAWDVIDDDARPLEAEPAPGRRVPPEAGTATVEQHFLAATAKARLIPVRVPDANPLALGGALAFAGQTPARIAVFLVGGMTDPQPLSWKIYADAAKRAPQLLIIVPAGHQGRDIDALTIAPAGLGVPNQIVVTEAMYNGLIMASWRARSVDVAVCTGLTVSSTMHPQRSSAILENAAALRLAALASEIAAKEPGLDGAALKARVLALAEPSPHAAVTPTRFGWIKKPVDARAAK